MGNSKKSAVWNFCIFALAIDPLVYILNNTHGLYFPISTVSILIIAPMALQYFLAKLAGRRLLSRIAILGLIMSCLIGPILSDRIDPELYLKIYRIIIYYIFMFYSVFYLSEIKIKRTINILLVLYPLSLIFIFSILDIQNILIDEKLNYLRVADNLSILGIISVTLVQNRYYKYVLIGIYSFLLIMSLSRAALLFFLFANLITIFSNRVFSREYFSLFKDVAFIGFVFMLVFKFSGDYSYRIGRLLNGDSIDSSLLERLEVMIKGINIIESNIYLGIYNWQVDVYGEKGYYIHNILSYLAQFGIMAFVLILVLIIVPLIYFYRNSHKMIGINDRIWNLGMSMSIFVLLNVLLSKSYVYDFALLPFGLFVGNLSMKWEN